MSVTQEGAGWLLGDERDMTAGAGRLPVRDGSGEGVDREPGRAVHLFELRQGRHLLAERCAGRVFCQLRQRQLGRHLLVHRRQRLYVFLGRASLLRARGGQGAHARPSVAGRGTTATWCRTCGGSMRSTVLPGTRSGTSSRSAARSQVNNGNCITPAQARAAVWHSLIAGAQRDSLLPALVQRPLP